MKILTAPDSLSEIVNYDKRLFLAGSIEDGKARDWQSEAINLIGKGYPTIGESMVVLNPRRKVWTPGVENSIDNPYLYRQVNWELMALERSTHILFYFQPETLSPISLLELGMYIDPIYLRLNKRICVVAPEGFFRKGNLDIVCERYSILSAETIEIAIDKLIG